MTKHILNRSSTTTAERKVKKPRQSINTQNTENIQFNNVGKKENDFQEADSVRQQAQPYRLVTARLPIAALTQTWSIGKNRRVDRQHARNLCSVFMQGGLQRRAEENHLLVLCSASEVARMMDHLGSQGRQSSGPVTGEPDLFADWLMVNQGKKVELMAGQHRVEALREYVKQMGCGEEELWWTCEFYDRGMAPLSSLPLDSQWAAVHGFAVHGLQSCERTSKSMKRS